MIKELLKMLTKAERTQLMYAFEQDISQMVQLPDGRFIGVHIPVDKYVIEIQEGSWVVGKIK